METLSASHSVFIYARGGEHYAKGDPLWDFDRVTWGKRVTGKPWDYVDWRDFQAWVKANQIEAVIFNEQQSWEIVIKILTKLHIPIGSYIDYYTEKTVPFFSLYDFLLCNTQRHHGVFRSHPHAYYIPWGTDIETFRPTSRDSDGTVTFFHSGGMGGINLRKGTDILVKAFQRVQGAARLLVHSQVPLVRYGQEVAQLVNQDKRIDFIEATVPTPGLYHLGDVYVYPSRLEGIGLSIAEALACGLPVITTDAAPMNEFVLHNVNGKLVRVDRTEKREDNYYWPQTICSESALAEAMQSFVDHPEALQGFKTRTRQHAEMHLNWNKNSVGLPKLISDLKPCRSAEHDRQLCAAAARYEKSLYPPFRVRARIALGRAGAGRVRRWLKSLLTKNVILSHD
jgi:glycosyltransferase involved in cell wall biosynthesis